MRMLRIIAPLLLMLVGLLACGPRNGITERGGTRKPAADKRSRLLAPGSPLVIASGEKIDVELEVPDTLTVDSVQIFLRGALKTTLREGLDAVISTEGEMTGKASLRLRVFFGDGKSENQVRQITFLSDLVPKEYSYRVVNEYPHDATAYTQGLHYADGYLYEGTGNYGKSSLRRVEPETGRVLNIRNLDESFFGEGVTVFGDRIYQLTYRSQVGFIYDKESFEEIQKIYYQNREGWGLTHNGEELIMSDGTNIIYFLDPELFTINRQIEVYHHEGPADSLNELEYIDGKIWANRYYTDEIVIIDPATGKVEGRINLKGILKTSDRQPTTDVLNGIAWDSEGERIFVTGKRWPKLFEIKLIVLPKSP